MRRAGLLVIVFMVVSGQSCLAKGKTLGPLRVPGFVQANNGLGVAAALRGGDYVSRVIMHFMGMDPPLVWVQPPKTADLIPAWMDEPVAMPASFTPIGIPACGRSDYGGLATALRADPSPAVSVPRAEGLIHFDAPAAVSAPAASSLDSREIYGHSAEECTQSARG